MSRFVSAGTAEEPPERDDDWIKAQQELEDNSRRRREEASGLQDGGKSLYEVLQANKAAKQEQFEESARLKNQFRSLDEDEVDFLDSVLESTRAKDDAIRRETSEQLDAFRRQQEEAEKAARAELDGNAAVDVEEEQWRVTARKRKKAKEKDAPAKGFKLRKTSSASSAPKPTAGKIQEPESPQPISPASITAPAKPTEDGEKSPTTQSKSTVSPKPTLVAGFGLDAYSSDDE